MTNKTISYGQQSITEDDIQAVADTLRADFLTQGPMVEQFEKKFAELVQASHAVAVCNATAALHLAALALGVKPGQKILTTSNTFVASSNCVRYCGGDVKFIDIDSKTLCLDPDKLEAELKSAPAGTYSGIITVSFAGYPVDTERLRQIADRHKLWMIEDASHAPGAEFKNSQGEWVKTGSGQYADLTVFSFHPVKHIATGEGGMITTRNAKLDKQLRLLRSHGIERDRNELSRDDGGWYYEMQQLGFNYRIPDINCALGLSQLRRFQSNIESRRRIAARYSDELKSTPLTLPSLPPEIRHGFHLYVIETEKRKELYDYLKENKIYCQVHYIPVHMQPYYVSLYGNLKLPLTEAYYSKGLSIPMYHGLTEEQQNYVIDCIKKFFA